VPPRELRATVTRLLEIAWRRRRAGVSPRGSNMARILLVDNDAGDRARRRARARIREQELERSNRSRRRWCAAAEAGHPFVLVSPATWRRRWRRARPPAATCCARLRRVRGRRLPARTQRALKVANAIGERLFRSALKAELQAWPARRRRAARSPIAA
jgi:hypothetical protein